MKLSNKVYDVLKWLVVIVLPAVSTFYSTVAPLFGWYLSLVDYKVGQPIFKSRFVGLYFFKMLFTSRDMSRIMRNSIILSALKTVSLVLPPVFAILLNELNNSRFRKFAPAGVCARRARFNHLYWAA